MGALAAILNLLFLLSVNGNPLKQDTISIVNNDTDDVFKGVYTECFVRFSFTCVQRKTLMYLQQLDNLSEVSIIGDYLKFVRLNTSKSEENMDTDETSLKTSTRDLTKMIDEAVDRFFDNHVIKLNAMGRDISISHNVEEFVGRKKRKGGGGGGMMVAHDGGHFSHKKMMMMAMMCMKMKLMMMLPAMMGMMGMMSFKGMMFSMMSFMVSKMMLLMKILEKKGGFSGAGGGGNAGDGGWAVSGGSSGAWMPAGGQDLGNGGGYDANGQWQSRSIIENKDIYKNKPVISYITPVITYNKSNKFNKITDNVKNDDNNQAPLKIRRKRSIVNLLQNSYKYWMNMLLGFNNNRRTSNIPKYKIVNGIKYVYYPNVYHPNKSKMPKEIKINKIVNNNEETPIITAEDFNKGEIMEGAVVSRMMRRKLQKIKDSVNETLDDNPWQ